jgi:hypothetical protein
MKRLLVFTLFFILVVSSSFLQATRTARDKFLDPEARFKLKAIAERLGQTKSADRLVLKDWKNLIDQMQHKKSPISVDSLVEGAMEILHVSHREKEKSLQSLADKLNSLTDIKTKIREELNRLQVTAVSTQKSGGQGAPLRYPILVKDFSPWLLPYQEGTGPTEVPESLPHGMEKTLPQSVPDIVKPPQPPVTPAAPLTKLLHTPQALSVYLKHLGEQLLQLENTGQSTSMKLQEGLQKQQQDLQVIENLKKVLHDTAQASMRKVD